MTTRALMEEHRIKLKAEGWVCNTCYCAGEMMYQYCRITGNLQCHPAVYNKDENKMKVKIG